MENKTIKLAAEDVTPTWEQVLPIHIMVLMNANSRRPKGVEASKVELHRMARVADKHNAEVRLQNVKEEATITIIKLLLKNTTAAFREANPARVLELEALIEGYEASVATEKAITNELAQQ